MARGCSSGVLRLSFLPKHEIGFSSFHSTCLYGEKFLQCANFPSLLCLQMYSASTVVGRSHPCQYVSLSVRVRACVCVCQSQHNAIHIFMVWRSHCFMVLLVQGFLPSRARRSRGLENIIQHNTYAVHTTYSLQRSRGYRRVWSGP